MGKNNGRIRQSPKGRREKKEEWKKKREKKDFLFRVRKEKERREKNRIKGEQYNES